MNAYEKEVKKLQAFIDEDIPCERNKLTWEGLTGKRFERYKVKLSDAMLDLLSVRRLYSNIRPFLKDVFRDCLGTIDEEHPIEYQSHSSRTVLTEYYKKYTTRLKHKPLFLYINDRVELDKMIEHVFSEEVFDHIYSMVCRQYILSCVPDDDDDTITEDNYFSTIHAGDGMTASAFTLLFERVFLESQIYLGNMINQGISQAIQNEREAEIGRLKKDLEAKIVDCQKLSSSVSDYQTQLKNAKDDIIILNKKIVDDNNEKLAESQAYSDAIRRENEKIRNQYKSLMRKYLELRNKDNQKAEKVDELIELPELNYNGRYVFIVYDDVTFRNSILDTFPNSIIIDSQTILDPSYVDMVVFITTHIDHATYLGMKRQCKKKNIPMVHCEHSNIDLMKQLMLNTQMAA